MLKKLRKGFVEKFIKIESISGFLLFGMMLIALLWANSRWSETYYFIWNYKIGFEILGFELIKPIQLWINDGLMAIFFFLIGLEIKREIIIGELNSPKKAAFPIFAALGGMTVPALCYIIFNNQYETSNGWAIPMATDIAFSLAILQLLGNKAPLNLKIFLTAFAIVDDLGAVIIIALFYGTDINLSLIISGLALAACLYFIFLKFYSKIILALVGFVVWYLFLKGGIHPTIAGVLLALTIPIRQKVNIENFTNELDNISKRIKSLPKNNKGTLSKEQIEELDNLEDFTNKVQSPLQNIEHNLHNWVAYLIMPIFALTNAGVSIISDTPIDYYLVLVIGISLIVGKSIGISFIALTAVKLKFAKLPDRINNLQIIGVAFLAGVGFTMSIFISNLAFNDNNILLDSSKIGIIFGSFISGLIGYLILKFNKSQI